MERKKSEMSSPRQRHRGYKSTPKKCMVEGTACEWLWLTWKSLQASSVVRYKKNCLRYTRFELNRLRRGDKYKVFIKLIGIVNDSRVKNIVTSNKYLTLQNDVE